MRLGLIFAMVLLCQHCSPSEKQLAIKLGNGEARLTVSVLKKQFGAQNVTVDDHYLKKSMQYRAIKLKQLIQFYADKKIDFDEIVFACADGYMAHASRSDFEKGKLDTFYLAFGEAGDTFKTGLPQGKALVSPEPFYVIATDSTAFSVLSWPYEVTTIEFVSLREKFPGIFAAGAPQAGFNVFRRECLKCHSINLSGGDVGPELNVPKNITEYRERTTLALFIENAASYRAKSKMPPMPHLSKKEIADVIDYLAFMRLHKRAAP